MVMRSDAAEALITNTSRAKTTEAYGACFGRCEHAYMGHLNIRLQRSCKQQVEERVRLCVDQGRLALALAPCSCSCSLLLLLAPCSCSLLLLLLLALALALCSCSCSLLLLFALALCSAPGPAPAYKMPQMNISKPLFDHEKLTRCNLTTQEEVGNCGKQQNNARAESCLESSLATLVEGFARLRVGRGMFFGSQSRLV